MKSHMLTRRSQWADAILSVPVKGALFHSVLMLSSGSNESFRLFICF